MTNICITLYDNDFDISFDCSGALKCKYSFGELMPPEDDEGCAYRQHGSCRYFEAQKAAMESVKRRLAQQIKNAERHIVESR